MIDTKGEVEESKVKELEAREIIDGVLENPKVSISDERREVFVDFITTAMAIAHERAEETVSNGVEREGEKKNGSLMLEIPPVKVEDVLGSSEELSGRIGEITDTEKEILQSFVTTVSIREKDSALDRIEHAKKETTTKVKKLKDLMDLYEGVDIVENATDNGDGTVTITERVTEQTGDNRTVVVVEDGKPKPKTKLEDIVVSKEVLESIPRAQKNLLVAEGINEFASRTTMKEEKDLKDARTKEQDEKIKILRKKKEAAEIADEMSDLEYALRRLQVEKEGTTDEATRIALENQIGEHKSKFLEKGKSLQMTLGDVVTLETTAALSGKASDQIGPAVRVDSKYSSGDVSSVINSLERLGSKGRNKTTSTTSTTHWEANTSAQSSSNTGKVKDKKKKTGSRLDDVLNTPNTGANINDTVDGSRAYTGGRRSGSKDGSTNLDSIISGIQSGANGTNPQGGSGNSGTNPKGGSGKKG